LPTASTDLIRINYSQKLDSAPYRIMDMRGMVVENGQLSHHLSISHLRPGVYVLEIRSYGQKIRKKIVRL
ncbi:MAG: T9SS type A sorting domain-containing protein, partial [Bacteroidales bacterium]